MYQQEEEEEQRIYKCQNIFITILKNIVKNLKFKNICVKKDIVDDTYPFLNVSFAVRKIKNDIPLQKACF